MKKSKSRSKESQSDVSNRQQKSQPIELEAEHDKKKENRNHVNINQRILSTENSTFKSHWKKSKEQVETNQASSSENQTGCAHVTSFKQCRIQTSDDVLISNEKRDYRSIRSEAVQSSSQRHNLDDRPSTHRYFGHQRKFEESDFYQFERNFRKNVRPNYVVEEVEKNLFDISPTISLAHCVAEDMNMGSGIAVEFRHKFKQVANLLNQNIKTGGVAVLKDQNRFVYYLVTKMFSSGKPTYRTLFSSLEALRRHVKENNVKTLAMPKIGCGLDRLDWEKVKFMIEYIFQNVKIQITICNLQMTTDMPPQNHLNCKLKNETYPIEKIEDETIFLFLSPEDRFISDEMKELNKKFEFAHAFDHFKKVLGNVFFYPTKDVRNLLCGCIVKQHTEDPIDFVAFGTCLQKIKKENRKYELGYIAMQAFRDQADPCIMFKIINILRNTMHDVEVYICWPGDLQQDLLPREPRSSYSEQFKRQTLNPTDFRRSEKRRRSKTEVDRTETVSDITKNKNIEDKTLAEQFDEKEPAGVSECWDNSNEVSETVLCENFKLFEQYLTEKAKGQLTNITNQHRFQNKYSRVCFVREDLVFESGVPTGTDVTNLIGPLLDKKLEEGNCVFVEDEEKFLFCLVISNIKKIITSPNNIFTSIEKLRDYAKERKIKQLVIGRIDNKRLQWTEIENMFGFLFKDEDVDLIVDFHPEEHQLSNANFKHVKFPIHKMKNNSILLYIASTDNKFTHSMDNLQHKFRSFNPAIEKTEIGDITIYKPDEYFVVYGCLVKKASDDPISFEALQKCLQKAERHDKNNVNYKITTLLLTCLPEYTVFLGWPGHLLNEMPSET